MWNLLAQEEHGRRDGCAEEDRRAGMAVVGGAGGEAAARDVDRSLPFGHGVRKEVDLLVTAREFLCGVELGDLLLRELLREADAPAAAAQRVGVVNLVAALRLNRGRGGGDNCARREPDAAAGAASAARRAVAAV